MAKTPRSNDLFALNLNENLLADEDGAILLDEDGRPLTAETEGADEAAFEGFVNENQFFDANVLTIGGELLTIDGEPLSLGEASLQSFSLIIAKRKTAGGVLVHSAKAAWFDFVRRFSKDPSAWNEIDHRQWEELIAGAYEEAGFDEVILTSASGDRGRDVIATKYGLGKVRIVNSHKTYRPDRSVDYDDVRALMGVMTADPAASKGIITTTGRLPPKVLEDELIMSFVPKKLEMIDGKALQRMLAEIAAKSKSLSPVQR